MLTVIGFKPGGRFKYTFTHKQETKQHNETECSTYITIKIRKLQNSTLIQPFQNNEPLHCPKETLNFSLHFTFFTYPIKHFSSLYSAIHIYNLLPLTSLHFTFFHLPYQTLLFTLFCYSYLQLTSLNFTSLHFSSPFTFSKLMHVTN